MGTPFGNLMLLPSESLAYGLAGEWGAQEDRIKPALMPLMTLCTTAIDIIPRTKERTMADILKFLSSDTVCCFADPDKEPGLYRMQEEIFLPIIEWFNKTFEVKLTTNYKEAQGGNMLVLQSDEVRDKIRRKVGLLNDWELSGLDKGSGEAKSTCIAAMLCSGAISAKEAQEAAKTEERYQIGRWGDVPSSHGVDFALSRLLLSSVQFYSACLRESGISSLKP